MILVRTRKGAARLAGRLMDFLEHYQVPSVDLGLSAVGRALSKIPNALLV